MWCAPRAALAVLLYVRPSGSAVLARDADRMRSRAISVSLSQAGDDTPTDVASNWAIAGSGTVTYSSYTR